MLEVVSGISLAVIEQRGYWTAYGPADVPEGFADFQKRASMFPALVIPQWNTVGRCYSYLLRPDQPRQDGDGKTVKYQAIPGGALGFDLPPLMVPDLRNPLVPLYITEGSKKADAAATHGLLCLSLNGVYGFLHNRLVVSELDEIALDGRDVRLAYDGDVMRKAGVQDALDRLAAAIHKRGGRVWLVQLPDSDGGKVGLDDFLAAGGTIAELDSSMVQWRPVRRPKATVEYADPHERINQLQQLVSAQARLIVTSELKDKQRAIGFRAIIVLASKQSRGKVGTDGRARLTARELSGDHRPKPEPGETLPARNPDGTRPICKRSDVKRIMSELREAGALPSTEEPTLRPDGKGGYYEDTDYVLTGDDSVVTAIEKLADHRKQQERKPYKRQEPCPHCGEIHDRTVKRQTICGTQDDLGCGTILDETVVTLLVPARSDPDATVDVRAIQ